MKFIKSNIFPLAGVIIGGVTGFLYWQLTGKAGSCTITAKPFTSAVYGAIVGGLLLLFYKKNNQEHI
ncbi:MAG: hypothetical protein QM727_11710 [Niabella sp.]